MRCDSRRFCEDCSNNSHSKFRRVSGFIMQNKRDGIWKMQKKTLTMFTAEIIGTAILLFLGCMGSVGSLGPTSPPPLQTALAFGLTVNLVILTIGHISGAHLNPAVTIGAVIIGLKSIPTGVVYILGQLIGATVGYGILKIVTPTELLNDGNSNIGVCVTVVHPGISTVQGLLIEIFCTSILVCAACATWDPRCSHISDSVAVKFGLAVTVLSFTAGPYTGCSMNPVRTFAPAFWNNAWKDHWIYWVGPFLGALLGTFAYQVLFATMETQSSRKECLSDKKSVTVLSQSNNVIM